MWKLISDRDQGTFHTEVFDEIVINGQKQSYPVEGTAQINPLPYLPDPLARAAAFRNLPGTSGTTIGRAAPGAGAAQPMTYEPIPDAQPRPGTATIVECGGRSDWQQVRPFRLALADGSGAPVWDPAAALLTVSLPKGQHDRRADQLGLRRRRPQAARSLAVAARVPRVHRGERGQLRVLPEPRRRRTGLRTSCSSRPRAATAC